MRAKAESRQRARMNVDVAEGAPINRGGRRRMAPEVCSCATPQSRVESALCSNAVARRCAFDML
jgi:hypothetical protein